jgi:hypothetical protein
LKHTWWVAGAAAVLAARLCHSGVLWPEEGLPMAAAVQMLHGRALYSEVWFDKPPLVAAFYLLWGAHTGVMLRLAGALYVLAACSLIYRFAREMWSEREGRAAALLLGFFLTFGIPSAVMALAADVLTIAPHIAAIWLAYGGRASAGAALQRRIFLAGLASGIAFQCNTKAAFVLAFCALVQWRRLPALLAGFAVPNLLVLAWVGGDAYYEQVWKLGFIYARDTFVANPLGEAFTRTLNWAGFHAALVIAAAVYFVRERNWRFAVWILLALGAVAAGWRFFPRYYFHLLPAMALAAARGFTLLGHWRVLVLATLLVPLVRFGPRYVTLAVRGDGGWSDTAMDRNSREAARAVMERARPGDTLFVWGYRPDIFVYTRMAAASRFLESQPLTGVFADRHLFDARPSYPEWAERNRRELARTRPAFVLDGIAPYNPRLGIEQYPDLRPWLAGYRTVGTVGATVISEARADGGIRRTPDR